MKVLCGTLTLMLLGGVVLSTLSKRKTLIAIHSPSTPTPTTVLKGRAIVGTILTSLDQQGRKRTLKIADVQLDPQDSAGDIYLYTILSQGENGKWHNFCLPDPKGVTKVIPLTGRWDQTGNHIADSSITFACTNGALAKCVRWGYKPWKTVKGISLKDYHQACIRMARADYCGDGRSHTQNGTPIDVYDRLGLHQRTPNSGMTFEAAWTPEGAVYLNRTRFSRALTQVQKTCPEKLASTLTTARTVSHDPQSAFPQALLFNDSFIQRAVLSD